MSEPQVPIPRKRQRLEQRPLLRNGGSQPLPKRQKLFHPDPRSQSPSAFWDKLSKIHLTKSALRELDRRNTLSASISPRPSYRRPHQPPARYALAELKRNHPPTQSALDYLCNCAPRHLKEVQLSTRHGGPDLTDLRGYPEHNNPLDQTMHSTQSRSRARKRDSTATLNTRPTTNTTTTQTTGSHDHNFGQSLIDGGVYPHAYVYPDGKIPAKPNNWKEINQRLAQPRASLSPSKFSEEDYEKFIRADADAATKKQIITSVFPIIEGNIKDAKCVSGWIRFRNLDYLTDEMLVPGNPDIYYGARPEQLDRRVRDDLSGHVIPSTQDSLPLMPNFFVALEGPDGTQATAKRQACYDGALGARGIHSLQSYGQEDPSYDQNAFSISSTYSGGTFQMFTSYATQSGDRPECFMHQVRGRDMTDSIETFRQGATYYRSGRDWAKEQRDAAIRQANERVNEHHADSAR